MTPRAVAFPSIVVACCLLWSQALSYALPDSLGDRLRHLVLGIVIAIATFVAIASLCYAWRRWRVSVHIVSGSQPESTPGENDSDDRWFR